MVGTRGYFQADKEHEHIRRLTDALSSIHSEDEVEFAPVLDLSPAAKELIILSSNEDLRWRKLRPLIAKTRQQVQRC